MNVALFGGAFDPLHKGHVQLAVNVAQYFDQVWIVPCYGHKHGKNMTDAQKRLKICEEGLSSVGNNIFLNDFEIVHKITTGTYDSLILFKQNYPDYNFSVIIGQDNAETIDTWENHKKLTTEFSFVVYPRGLIPSPGAWYLETPHKYLKDFLIPPYSSSEIKKLIKKKDFDEVYKMLPNKRVLELAMDFYQ